MHVDELEPPILALFFPREMTFHVPMAKVTDQGLSRQDPTEDHHLNHINLLNPTVGGEPVGN